MGKRLLIAAIIIIIGNVSVYCYDVVQINIDKKTLGQLELNTFAQIATNELHNIQVDSVKKKQKRLMVLVDGIAAQKELIIQTYENVSGFKQESKYYIAIANTGLNIINHSTQVVQAVNKSKMPGKAKVILNVSDLVTQAISLGKAFSDIVANCEVPNPLKQSERGTKDKYNLLNRHERLYMANDILFRLRGIDHTLCYLIYLAKHSDWKDVLFQLDRKTYITYVMTKVNANEIINKWERVTK